MARQREDRWWGARDSPGGGGANPATTVGAAYSGVVSANAMQWRTTGL